MNNGWRIVVKMHLIEPKTCIQSTPTALLIHPMLSSAEGMKTVLVNNMGDDLRYLIPDLAAHGEEDARNMSRRPKKLRRFMTGCWSTT